MNGLIKNDIFKSNNKTSADLLYECAHEHGLCANLI